MSQIVKRVNGRNAMMWGMSQWGEENQWGNKLRWGISRWSGKDKLKIWIVVGEYAMGKTPWGKHHGLGKSLGQ